MERLEKILNNLEDTAAVKDALNKIGAIDYIGFSFHKNAFNNLKLLSTLEEVIPDIKDFKAHEGSICIYFFDETYKIFSGVTTREIVRFLVHKKFDIK